MVSGTTPHGRGHETSWSQIVADKFGVSPTSSRSSIPTRAITPQGMDTYGSRSLPVGGVAVAMAADEVIAKAKRLAAHQLECAEEDLELVEASCACAAPPRSR